MNVCNPFNSKFSSSKPFYMLKRTNEEGRQSLRGFPRPEITWLVGWMEEVKNLAKFVDLIEAVRIKMFALSTGVLSGGGGNLPIFRWVCVSDDPKL